MAVISVNNELYLLFVFYLKKLNYFVVTVLSTTAGEIRLGIFFQIQKLPTGQKSQFPHSINKNYWKKDTC